MSLFEAEEFRNFACDGTDSSVMDHVAKMSDDEIVSEINDLIDWEEISDIITDAFGHLLRNIEYDVLEEDE